MRRTDVRCHRREILPAFIIPIIRGSADLQTIYGNERPHDNLPVPVVE